MFRSLVTRSGFSSNLSSGFYFSTTLKESLTPKHIETDFYNLPIFKNNRHKYYGSEMIPLPANKNNNHFYDINYSSQSLNEPKFDASIHLNLQLPDYISLLPDFKKKLYPLKNNEFPPAVTDEINNKQSKSLLGYTSPFSLLSNEGIKVIKSIIKREMKQSKFDYRNYSLRGLYYLSPFIRDLCNSEELMKHFELFTGEPIQAHHILIDPVVVNIGKLPENSDDTSNKVIDHWHIDSVAYVAVVVLSDVKHMVGGELEIISRDKSESIELFKQNKFESLKDDIISVNYDNIGQCVLIQGSEFYHHVNGITSGIEDRISLLFDLQPRNIFQSNKFVLDTYKKFDKMYPLAAEYEFFRSQCWRLANILKYYTTEIEYNKDCNDDLISKLEDVKQELDRTIKLMKNEIKDNIGYYDENIGKYTIN